MEQAEAQVTVEDMKVQVARVKELRDTEAQINAMKKECTEQLEKEESKMLSMLEASGLKNFKTDQGMVGITCRTSVKTPKTPEDRAAFFAYLKEQGLFDQMITVNSQSLNALYRDQLKAAQERGEDDFKIPGIDEETITQILTFKRA